MIKQTRRSISFVLVIALIMTLSTFSVPDNTYAATFSVTQDNVNYTLDDATNSATVIGLVDRDVTKVAIATSITTQGATYNVNSINLSNVSPGYNFYNNTKIEEVTMPTSPYSIDSANTFRGCTSLRTIDLSNATQVYNNAFNGCKSLETVDLSNVINIRNSAFQNCTSISSVTFPDATNFSTYSNAFNGCTSLQTVDISRATSMAGNEFNGCTSLKTVVMEDCTNIGVNAFSGCASLTNVTMPTVSYTMGNGTFQNCKSLETIDISKATAMGSSFSGCTSLSSVTMPTSAYTMGASIFNGCSSLDTIDVSGANVIDAFAFTNCISLSNITMPTTAYAIGDNAFKSCTSLAAVDLSNATAIGTTSNNQFSYGRAFGDCTSLNNVTMPTRSYTIGNYAFSNCTSLETIDLSNATVIGTNGTTAYDGKAFDGCISLSSITMPTNTYTLGTSAFSGCTSIKTIDLSNVTGIGDNAFNGCTSLELTVVPSSEPAISENSFNDVSPLILLASGSAKDMRGYEDLSNFPACSAFPEVSGSGVIENGNTLNLDLTVTNDELLGYQWQKDGVDISGSSSNSFSKTVMANDSGDYTCKVSFGNISFVTNAKNVKVIADFTVNLDVNGGSVLTNNKLTVRTDDTYKNLPIPSRTGYKFKGWYTDKTGGTKVENGTKIVKNADHSLYAQWDAIPKTTTKLSKNNYLKSLKVSKGKLNKKYKKTKTSYTVKLKKKQSKTKITATKAHSKAKVQIKVGKNKWKTTKSATVKVKKGKTVTVKIKVTSESKTVKTYTVKVRRAKK